MRNEKRERRREKNVDKSVDCVTLRESDSDLIRLV